MLTIILNKLLVLLFFMSCLNVVRHLFYFMQAWTTSTDENPQRYVLSTTSLWVLGASLGFILMSVLTGIGL